jgi:hypothetical protein
MPLHHSCLLVTTCTLTMTTLSVVQGRGESWYATICSTGPQHPVTFDDRGHVPFGSGDSLLGPNGNLDDNNTNDTDETDQTDSENDTANNGETRRWLRHSGRFSSAAASSALPWMPQTQPQPQQNDGRTLYDLDYLYNMTILPDSQRNSSNNNNQQLPRLFAHVFVTPNISLKTFTVLMTQFLSFISVQYRRAFVGSHYQELVQSSVLMFPCRK